MNELFQKLDIPKECEVNSTIFKKLFCENAAMNKNDRAVFSEQIDKVIWLYSFKNENINIKPYADEEREYGEVAVIEVILNSDLKYKKICEIIQRTIPYPIVIVMKYKNCFLLNAAHKRINKADVTKNTVEEFIYTEWIDLKEIGYRDEVFLDKLNIKKLSYTNFYEFYSDIISTIVIYNASKYTEDCEALYSKDAFSIKAINEEIDKLELEIEDIKRKINNEIYINKKVQMNVNIKKLKDKLEKLKEKLKA